MRVKASWSFGFFTVHFRDGDCYRFRAITMRSNVEVDDALYRCVPGLSVASLAVMSDVVCTGQDNNPGIFKFCCCDKKKVKMLIKSTHIHYSSLSQTGLTFTDTNEIYVKL